MVGAGLWLTAVLRWLLLTGLAVALGGVAGRGLARQLAVPGPAPLPGPWALRASLLGMLASAGLAVQARHGLLGTGAGVVAVIELASFGVAAVLLRLRRPGLSTVALVAVAGAEGFRDHPERIIPVGGALLTCVHLVPAAMWTGMLCYTVRAALAWRADTAAVRRLVGLYARAAAWLFTLTVVTGVTAALVLVPIDSLLTTDYGRVLIIKAAVVAAAAALAVGGRLWLRRGAATPAAPADAVLADAVLADAVPAGAAMPAGAGTPAGPGTLAGPAVQARPATRVGPALVTRLEAAMLIVVLAVTALLTVLSPPRTRPLVPASSPPGQQVVHGR